MEKMEQLEKASKEQQDEGLRAQTPDWKEPHAFERAQHTHGRTAEEQEREEEVKSRRYARGRQTSPQHKDRALKEALEIRDDDPQELAGMQKQRLDDAAVQLEKIFGFGRRGMKESEKYDRAGQARWAARRRRLDAERADVKRKAGAAKEGVKRLSLIHI